MKIYIPGENARSWGALGEARPGQSSLSAGALRYRAWAQSWSSAALAAPLVHGLGVGITLETGCVTPDSVSGHRATLETVVL